MEMEELWQVPVPYCAVAIGPMNLYNSQLDFSSRESHSDFCHYTASPGCIAAVQR